MSILPDCDEFLSSSSWSARTRELYAHYLGDFIDWAGVAASDQVSVDLVRSYLDAHPGWSASTAHSAAAAIRGFCRWRFGAHHPVVVSVRVRRVDPGPQRTLTAAQLSALLASLDTCTPAGIRNLALLTLLADSGLRASEVCRLDLAHLHLAEGYLSVIVKGGQWGSAWFYDYTRSCLAGWLGVRARLVSPGVRTVFVSTRTGLPLSRDGLRVIFRRLGQAAGLEALSPHDLRRTFATLASLAGAPDRIIQVAGRWSSVGMVQRYTGALHPSALRPWSPVDRLMDLD